MANDLKLKVTLTGDGKSLSGTLRDTTKEVTDFGTTADTAGKRADEALDRPRQGAKATGKAVHEATDEVRDFGTTTQRSGRLASAAMDDTGRSVKTVEDYLQRVDGIGRSVRNQIVGVGAAFAGAFAADALRGQARAITQTDALAQAVGVSTTRLQEWQYAGQQVGLEADKVGDIFKDTQDKIGDFIATGGGEAADLFKNLSINVQELRQLRPDEQLLKIVDAINQIDDPSQRVFYLESIADDASRLIPLLQDGGQLLRQYSAEARDLGVAMSQIDIENAKEADHALRQIGSSVEGLANQLVSDLGPGLATTADYLTDLVRDAGGAGNVLDGLVTTGEVLAALLAGRLAQGVTAYIGRIAAANGATLTLTGTLRTLRGVMLTAFGPVGIVVAAAGVLYNFREELGLVPKPAREAKQAIEELTGAIDQSSRATLQNGIASYRAKLSELQTQAESVRAEIERVNDENNVPGPFRNSLVMGEGAEERSQYLRQLQTISEQSEAYKGSIKELEEEFGELGTTTTRTTKPITTLGDSQTDAATAADTQADSLQGLLDRLDPLAKSQRDYTADQITLQTAWAGGKLTLDQYLVAVGQLDQLYRNAGNAAEEYGLSGQQAAKTVTREMTALETALNRSVERLDDSFVDFWEDTLSGAENTFQSFKDLAISTLAEIIHAYTTRQITANISTAISGGGAPGTGASAGFGTNGMDLGSLGKTLYNGVVDGFGSISWGGVPTGATSYSTGFGSQIAGGGGQFGGSLQNFGGFNGVASLGAGYVGSQVGTQLGSSVFGKDANSNYGAMAGGAIGTYFGGPLGALAGGALGGVLDSAFGSSRTVGAGLVQDNSRAVDGFYGSVVDGESWSQRDSKFGQFGLSHKVKMDPDDLADWLDGLKDIDNELARAANDGQVGAVRDALDGQRFSEDGGDSIAEITEARIGVIIDGLKSASSDAVVRLIDNVGDVTADNLEQKIPEIASALQLGNFVDGLTGNVRDYAERVIARTTDSVDQTREQLVSSIQNFGVVSDAANSLNLKFNTLANNAIDAADSLVKAAGGIEQFQAQAESYYQAFYTETERTARQTETLNEALRGTGLSAASTRDEFRDVVESLNLNSSAGRETYSTLMSVAGTFAQLVPAASDAADANDELIRSEQERARAAAELAQQRNDLEIQLLDAQGRTAEATKRRRQDELESLDGSLTALQKQIYAQQDANDAAEAAADIQERYASALANARDFLGGAITNINEYINRLNTTDAGAASPGDQLAAAGGAFREQLEAARGGDRDALSSITQYADQYISAQRNWSGSGGETATVIDQIQTALSNLPNQVSAEQFLADEFARELAGQTDSLTNAIDLNGDGTKTALEAAITRNLDTTSRLSASLVETMRANGNKALTAGQVRDALKGKASDSQISSLIRTVDANGDGVISATELAAADGASRLVGTLRDEFSDLASTVLTSSQVRDALKGKATDAEISSLIRSVDANGDGLVSATEIAAADGASRLVGTLRDEFGDLSSQVLTASQVRDALKGKASDSQISSLIRTVDANGDGLISATELAAADTTSSLVGTLRDEFGDLSSQVLTAGQVRDALKGKATNSQISSLIRTVDANGDGMISATELAAADGASRLVSTLRGEFDSLAGTVLTANQVHDALAGKATDKEISNLIKTLDKNGDGLITQEEAQREAMVGLPGAIAASLGPLFDSIDLNLDGVLTYDEMRKALSGVASDEQLHQIFRTLDVNGDGQISRLEALRQSTDRTGDNTGDISGLTDRTLSQLASMDKHTRYNWREGITSRQRLTNIADVVESHLDDRWYGWQQSDNNHLTKAWREAISIRSQTTRVAEFMKKIYESPHTKFAKGGVFTNSIVSQPTMFNTAEMGEAGPEAIMPLSRDSSGSLGVRLDLPPMPMMPRSDGNAEMTQLLRRLAQLTAENKTLLQRLDDHGAAGNRLNQAGWQRSIDVAKRGTKAQEKAASKARLEAAR